MTENEKIFFKYYLEMVGDLKKISGSTRQPTEKESELAAVDHLSRGFREFRDRKLSNKK